MKKIILIATILVLMLLAVSCKGNNNSQKLVMLNGISSPIPQKIITMFEQENNIEVEIIEWNKNDDVDIETFCKNISTEIMAGKGPDVVLLDETLWYYLGGDKAVRSGAFMDINKLIKKDNSFDKSKLNNIIWDAGKIDNSQYIAPITYYIPLYVSSEELLNDADFNINNCNNVLEFINEAEKYEATDKIKNMPLYDSNMLSTKDFFFNSRCYNINHDTLSISIDNEKAKQILDYIYKYESKVISPKEYPFYENQSVMQTSWINNSFSDVIQTSRWLDLTGGKSVVIPIKDVNGNVSAMLNQAVAINSNSKNKEKGYSLLKYLVFDYMYGNTNYNGNIPIASSSVEYYYDAYLSGKNPALSTRLKVNGNDYILPPMNRELYNMYTQHISSVSYCSGFYGKADTILIEEIQPYLKGEKSYEECIQSAQSKLEIYISE